MLKQLYNHSSVGESVETLEQYKAYKAKATGGKVTLNYVAGGEEAMTIGTYNSDEVIYFYNDFENVTLSNADEIQALNNVLLPNETVNKIQFMIKERNTENNTTDLSKSVLFINIDTIRGYKVSTDGTYSVYKYETSDDVATKIRYLAIDDNRTDKSDTSSEYILVNYYTTN